MSSTASTSDTTTSSLTSSSTSESSSSSSSSSTSSDSTSSSSSSSSSSTSDTSSTSSSSSTSSTTSSSTTTTSTTTTTTTTSSSPSSTTPTPTTPTTQPTTPIPDPVTSTRIIYDAPPTTETLQPDSPPETQTITGTPSEIVITTTLYSVSTSDGKITTVLTYTSLETSPLNTEASSGSSFEDNTGGIVAVAIGVGVVLALIALAIFILVRRHNRKQSIKRLSAPPPSSLDLGDGDPEFPFISTPAEMSMRGDAPGFSNNFHHHHEASFSGTTDGYSLTPSDDPSRMASMNASSFGHAVSGRLYPELVPALATSTKSSSEGYRGEQASSNERLESSLGYYSDRPLLDDHNNLSVDHVPENRRRQSEHSPRSSTSGNQVQFAALPSVRVQPRASLSPPTSYTIAKRSSRDRVKMVLNKLRGKNDSYNNNGSSSRESSPATSHPTTTSSSSSSSGKGRETSVLQPLLPSIPPVPRLPHYQKVSTLTSATTATTTMAHSIPGTSISDDIPLISVVSESSEGEKGSSPIALTLHGQLPPPPKRFETPVDPSPTWSDTIARNDLLDSDKLVEPSMIPHSRENHAAASSASLRDHLDYSRPIRPTMMLRSSTMDTRSSATNSSIHVPATDTLTH